MHNSKNYNQIDYMCFSKLSTLENKCTSLKHNIWLLKHYD